MFYTGFLLELISNEIKIDYENDMHRNIIYNVLLELGVDGRIRDNKTVIKEVFASFNKVFGQNEYSNYDDNSLTFLNLSRNGYNYKTTLQSINGELIINTNIVDEVNVLNESVSYKCIDIWKNIKKCREFERFDHILAEKNSVLFYHVKSDAKINSCGFYTHYNACQIEKNRVGFGNLKKSKMQLRRIEDYPCILFSDNGVMSYVPDLGDIDMFQSISGALRDSIEKACQDIPKNFGIIDENLKKNTEEDYDGQIKELYKKRYENYPIFSKQYKLKV